MFIFDSLAKYAHAAVARAIDEGQLPALVANGKTTGVPCADCGKPSTEYDHRDYFEQLKVEPTCHSCNLKRGIPLETLRKMGISGSKLRVLRDGCVGIVRTLRTRLKMTQRELAAALEIDAQTVSRWERGVIDTPKYVELAMEQLISEQDCK